MNKFTPGPWVSNKGEVFSRDGMGICVPYGISNQDLANANLIAAESEHEELKDCLKNIIVGISNPACDLKPLLQKANELLTRLGVWQGEE